MKTYSIAAIPGDGIGTEVISAGVEVLQALAKRDGSFGFKVDHFDWGGEYYKKHAEASSPAMRATRAISPPSSKPPTTCCSRSGSSCSRKSRSISTARPTPSA